MSLVQSLAISLFITEISELAAAACLGLRRKKEIYQILLINVITNPAAVFLSGLSGALFSWEISRLILAALEVIIFLIESLLFRIYLNGSEGRKVYSPFVLSLILNGTSLTAGLFVNYLQEVLL